MFKGEMIKELTIARKVTPAKQSLHIDPRRVSYLVISSEPNARTLNP